MISNWQTKFDNEFVKKPGEHLLIIGITGSGKTQVLIYVITRIMHLVKDETVVWFDMGKTTECFSIPIEMQKKTKIIIPKGCDIKNLEINADFDCFDTIEDIWDRIERDCYNIISINPFIIDPGVYSKTIDYLFRDLIKKAHHYYFEEVKGIEKLALAFDEFHNIAPAQGHTMIPEQNRIGAIIQMNIEKLRAFKIRFVASTQGETKIRKGVRTAFNWRIYRRISDRIIDIKRLESYQDKIQQLKINEALFVFPDKHFEILNFEEIFEYPDWNKNIQYRGIYEGEIEKKDNKKDIVKELRRDINVLEGLLYDKGISVEEIADKRGKSQRTIHYDLKRRRKEGLIDVGHTY